MVIAIIEESVIWANIWILSSIILLFLVFFVDAFSKNYKWKYYFLGKTFKIQKDEFFKNHPPKTKKDKKQKIKDMKLNYRRFGNIEFVVEAYKITPIKLYFEDFISFNYGNALDKQKIEFLLYALYSKVITGGGFYRFFETITDEPFSFDEYISLVKKSKLSKQLKEIMTNSQSKLIFEYSKNFDNLTDAEHDIMENYDLNESYLLYDYQDEIFDMVQKIAIDKFFKYHETSMLPHNIVEAYISKDKLKRISICYLEDLKVFNIVREDFQIYSCKNIDMSCDGGWIAHQGISYFETKNLALNDISEEIKDYRKIKISDLIK